MSVHDMAPARWYWPARATRRPHRADVNSRTAWPALQRGERAVLAVTDMAGRPVVATDRALHHQADDDQRWARWGWEQLARVSFDPGRNRLALDGLLPGVPRRTSVLLGADGTQIARYAARQVAATSLLSGIVDIGGRPARLLVRRQPATGQLLWLVAVDDTLDLSDPRLAGQVDAAIAAFRRHSGL